LQVLTREFESEKISVTFVANDEVRVKTHFSQK
jgi:hypothetical protein